MRRILLRSVAALTLAATVTVPQQATAQQLPTLPQPSIPQPTIPTVQDMRREVDRIEYEAYKALPKELQENPVFAGSSRPATKQNTEPRTDDPNHADKAKAQSIADDTCSNCVAITYDDGPDALTGQLLDTLKAKDAHASFMVLAPHAYAHPELLRRMKAEGHTVGNHTDTHRELNKLPAHEVDAEIKSGAAAIKAATGDSPRWVRPPYGATNQTVANAAKNNGQAQALWSIDTLDWKDRNSDHICAAAVDGAQAGDIILMHDIHITTVDAAPCVIDGLRAKGLEPVSLDTLIPNSEPGRQYLSK
ncbi:polysaccharide deacetylase family protein [Corynebacterium sp. HMSC074H12]|uniref:polysaccharide deacetylase family protein n=1 Tax=Corynebacterium sp. HMSC074H12 TaxID=1739436 RepID=UPI0008C0ABC8|nr:polysaccharide deacetylase family protein [Corynebacterium sp. HMSC074H12]OFQ55440.1 peptidoglycan N-acetylglucosamine deacetylase [Corynebacterium sp. HMSC074H12]